MVGAAAVMASPAVSATLNSRQAPQRFITLLAPASPAAALASPHSAPSATGSPADEKPSVRLPPLGARRADVTGETGGGEAEVLRRPRATTFSHISARSLAGFLRAVTRFPSLASSHPSAASRTTRRRDWIVDPVTPAGLR